MFGFKNRLAPIFLASVLAWPMAVVAMPDVSDHLSFSFSSAAYVQPLESTENTETPQIEDVFDHTQSLSSFAVLLQSHPGLFLGDMHSDENAGNYISENMTYFKALGVETLYVELGVQSQSDLFQAFNQRVPGADEAITDAMEERWAVYGALESRLALLFAARDAGIELVPVDVKDRSMYPSARQLHEKWIDVMHDRHKEGRGKYLFFGGTLHGSTKESVADILGIPNLEITEIEGARFINVSQFSETRVIEKKGEDIKQSYYLNHSVTPQEVIEHMLTLQYLSQDARDKWQGIAGMFEELESAKENVAYDFSSYVQVHEALVSALEKPVEDRRINKHKQELLAGLQRDMEHVRYLASLKMEQQAPQLRKS